MFNALHSTRGRLVATALLLLLCGAASCDGDAALGPSLPDVVDDGTADDGASDDVEVDNGVADVDAVTTDLPDDAELSDVIVISFAIDDRANAAYGPEDGLAWAGAFRYDPDTSFIVGFDTPWGPPWPMLWDDGPLSQGGHEPEGALAGDHVWSVAVFHARPEFDLTYGYGAVRGSDGDSRGDWIWPEPVDGSFTVTSGSGAHIEAPGFAIPTFGRVDYRIIVDGNGLDPDFLPVVPNDVSVIGVAWGRWLPASDDGSQDDVAGDGVFTFLASAHFGADCAESTFEFCAQTGLANSGDAYPFWVAIDGVEYRQGTTPLTDGVAVEVRRVADDDGGVVLDWMPVDVMVMPFDWLAHGRGLFVTVP